MPPQLMIQGVDIVLLGSFNPAIFQPSWLAAQGLIRAQEAEAAEIEVIHPEVAGFKTEWLHVNITRDRFQAVTAQEAFYEPLRDLVVAIFTLLRYTPLKALGINRNFHYRLRSEKGWHRVGDELAPKQHWKELLSNPGMRSLTMQGKRPDNRKGFLLARVEPSVREVPGVYVMINDHYELPAPLESPGSADDVITILSEEWARSMPRGLSIAEKILSLGEIDE